MTLYKMRMNGDDAELEADELKQITDYAHTYTELRSKSWN